jgi:hypothetical protein
MNGDPRTSSLTFVPRGGGKTEATAFVEVVVKYQEVSYIMKKVMLVTLCVLALAVFGMAQAFVPNSDILGAHNNGGRGCTGCHAPHSGAFGNGGNAANGGNVVDKTNTGKDALFGQDLGPLYTQSFYFGDGGSFVETIPAYAAGDEELRGIAMCLSCHDGNIAKGAMMTGKAYEQAAGLLPATGTNGAALYGPGAIPTWLGNDGTPVGNGQLGAYNNDHPVGLQATLGAAHVVGANGTGNINYTIDATAGITGLGITGGTPQANFETNYGFPSLRKGTWSWPIGNPVGNTDQRNLFLMCTTCHNQHVMNVYGTTYNATRNPEGARIAGGTGTFATYWFINAPYNMSPSAYDPKTKAPSTTQFCRQCHFGEANENYGLNTITTAF